MMLEDGCVVHGSILEGGKELQLVELRWLDSIDGLRSTKHPNQLLTYDPAICPMEADNWLSGSVAGLMTHQDSVFAYLSSDGGEIRASTQA